MSIGWTSSGKLDGLERFAKKLRNRDPFKDLDKYAKAGQMALRDATPVESGETAGSWYYVIKRVGQLSYTIEWHNSHVVDGAPIAVLIQFGHGTGTGGYVQPVDYVNPAMKPLFDKVTERVWKEVTSG